MNLFHELGKAREAGLPFLLIGGHAVIAHGYPRLTFDVDIVVPQTHAAQWKSWFEALGYRCFFETRAFFQLCPAGPDAEPADVMTVEAGTFEHLRATSVLKRHQGVELALPSAPHMVALKLHAVNFRAPADRGKDWLDIERLILANDIDVRAPAFRDMVLRYAGPGSYERILRARDEGVC